MSDKSVFPLREAGLSDFFIDSCCLTTRQKYGGRLFPAKKVSLTCTVCAVRYWCNEVYPSECLHKSGLRFHKSKISFHKSGISFYKSGISFYKSGSCAGKSGSCAGFQLIHIRGIDVVPFTRAYLRV